MFYLYKDIAYKGRIVRFIKVKLGHSWDGIENVHQLIQTENPNIIAIVKFDDGML
jgi:hypothetical protein